MSERPPDSLDESRRRVADVAGAPRSQVIGVLVLRTFVSACLFGVLFVLFSLMSGWHAHDSIGPFLVPLVLGFGVTAVPLVYKVVLSRHSFPLAVVVSALAVGAYSGAMGLLLATLARRTIDDLNVFWHLAGAGVWGLLAAAVGAFWPGAVASSSSRNPAEVDPSLSDQEWEKRAAAHLRARGDMTDARVREILAEARKCASADDTPLVSKFGSPSQYSRRPASQRGIAARRQALLYAAITAFPGWHLVRHVIHDGWTWDAGVFWAGLWLVAAATAAMFAWRASLQRKMPIRSDRSQSHHSP